MDLCKYAYYDANEKYCPNLYCNVDNKRCMYSKKCLKVDKFVPLEGEMWRECPKFIMAKRNEIPNGSYYVQTSRPNRKGNLYLYVVIDDKVEKILTDLTEINQDFVYVKKNSKGYKVSLTPFQKRKNTYLSDVIEEEKVEVETTEELEES